MTIDKIIKYLSSIFETSKISKSHYEALLDVLKKLETKEKRIESEIDAESNKQKRKKLNIALKIVKLQLRKGYFKLNTLKEEAVNVSQNDQLEDKHTVRRFTYSSGEI